MGSAPIVCEISRVTNRYHIASKIFVVRFMGSHIHPRLLPIQSDYRILSLDGGGVKDLSHQQNNILIADFRSFFAGGRTCWLSCSQGISLCAKL